MERTRFTEIWKNVTLKGFEKHYQVSNLGKVRSIPQIDRDHIGRPFDGRIRISELYGGNYKHITLSVYGKRRTINIHKLVALAFISNPLNKPQVNHKDGIKTNNNANNLEWVTASENRKHSFDVLGKVGVNKNRFGILSHHNKRVNQYNKNGTFITSYYSLEYAGKMTNITSSSICKALKGIIQSAGGFTWKYNNPTLAVYADRTFETTIKKGITKIKQI